MVDRKAASVLTIIISVFLFMIVFIALANAGVKIFSPFLNTKNSMDLVATKMTEVAKLPTNSVVTFQLTLDKDTAIIGMNPGKDFRYTTTMMEEINVFASNIKGFYFERPNNCKSDRVCLCTCSNFDLDDLSLSGYDYESGAISCSKLECISINDAVFPDVSTMPEVFDDKEREYSSASGKNGEIPPRSEHYWNNSIIILRSSKIDPSANVALTPKGDISNAPFGLFDNVGVAPLIVSGYRDYSPSKVIDVSLKNIGGGLYGDDFNPPIISVCLKETCK